MAGKIRENVLVTGGAGYIGSHVVRDLAKAGFNPIVFDNLSTGNREHVLAGDFVLGDLSDIPLLRETIKKYQIKSVLHFAACIEVEESVSQPLKYYQNNFINSLNLLQLCLQNGINHFVFSSTAAVYGIPQTLPIKEDAMLNPINPYGSSKMFTETVLKQVSKVNHHFNYVALRYFNVAGADGQARIGQKYKKPTHLITLALKTALGVYPQLKIFGSDYETRDGTAIRDYIHVDDLARAHILALAYLVKNKKSQILNCGYGQGYTVKEVLDGVKRVTGVAFKTVNSPRRAGDPPALVADAHLIRKVLGWQPQFDDLDYILKTGWDWEKKQRSSSTI